MAQLIFEEKKFSNEEKDFSNELKNLGKEIDKALRKEILLLYELGLEEYEIQYIIYLKTKEKARHKWGD
ncbi:MAG: hypothetical protein AABX71_01430 [Nanoarchaeota archaeon]